MNITTRTNMKPQYRSRICALINGTVIELARFRRALCASDWNFWSADRNCECWVERPLLDRETITARPGSRQCRRSKEVKQRAVKTMEVV